MTFLKKALTISAALACCATAQAELKVATVNVQKLFADYYKTHEAQKTVDANTAKLKEENDRRTAEVKAAEAAFQELAKKLQEPIGNEKEKAALTQSAELKKQEVIALENTRRDFMNRQLKSLQETMKRRSAQLMGDITEITKKHAEKAGYDMVVDSSAQSAKSNDVFMYTKPSMDITPLLIKELNKEAPAGFDPSKPATPAPAPETTPEASK